VSEHVSDDGCMEGRLQVASSSLPSIVQHRARPRGGGGGVNSALSSSLRAFIHTYVHGSVALAATATTPSRWPPNVCCSSKPPGVTFLKKIVKRNETNGGSQFSLLVGRSTHSPYFLILQAPTPNAPDPQRLVHRSRQQLALGRPRHSPHRVIVLPHQNPLGLAGRRRPLCCCCWRLSMPEGKWGKGKSSVGVMDGWMNGWDCFERKPAAPLAADQSSHHQHHPNLGDSANNDNDDTHLHLPSYYYRKVLDKRCPLPLSPRCVGYCCCPLLCVWM
jgi:hypothetical protein